MTIRNPISTDGFDFLEFTTTDPQKLSAQFESMGFHAVATHRSEPVTIYQQNDLRFIINQTKDSQASGHARLHGTSICSMGLKVQDANMALQYVRLRGATPWQPLDEKTIYDMPAIYGVGNMLIYFIDYKNGSANYAHQFSAVPQALSSSSPKLLALDHLTVNLYRGHASKWADFYSRLFNFQENHQSATEKKALGYKEKSMTSACGKIRISLSESPNEQSQIENFLNYFNGEGIRRITFNPASWFDIMDESEIESVSA